MLITGNTPGNDLRFHFERLDSARNFANKIWNASRFVLMHLQDYDPQGITPEFTLADNWILSRFNATVAEVTRNMERYDLGEAGRVLYEFIWNEFCDWYIELAKPRLYGRETPASKATAQYTLCYVLEHTMCLLHPFMPFLTEEIWQCLPHKGQTIMLTTWPESGATLDNQAAENEMALIMEVIKVIRNIRSEMNIAPGRQVELIIAANNAENLAILENGQAYLKHLANVGEFTLVTSLAEKPSQAVTAMVKGMEIFLPLAGLIDLEKEKERLEKEIAKLDQELARVNGKLNNQGFIAKAPEDVIAKEKTKRDEYQQKKDALQARLTSL
jgi:valyl-tRNA synthetase